MISIRGIIDKVASRKLGVTAVAGAAAATGAVEDHLADSGYSDGVYRGADGGGYVGQVGETEGKEKRAGSVSRPAFMRSSVEKKQRENSHRI